METTNHETVSFGIVLDTYGYVFIFGKRQTAFPGKKLKYGSRIHDFMFDNSGFGGEWFNASLSTMETMGITINTTSGPFVFFTVNWLNLNIKLAYLRPPTMAFIAFKVK